MADRVEFSKKTRIEAFARCGGKCEKCKSRLKVSEGEYDHIIPYFMSRDSSIDNCQVLCVPCHRGPGAKTADDQRVISKIKRVKMKHDGTFPPTKAKLRSRGFSSTRNAS
jgi:5-methylcytosine-specific restriction endonuclease McrA